MPDLRELSRAIALRDFDGAALILDVHARNCGSDAEHQIALGRVDAANIQRRAAKPALAVAA